MTKKRMRKPSRRLRLSSFERALRDAELRLAKATDERTACCQKLEALNGEIPYLEAIIHAFTPAGANVQPLDGRSLDNAYDAVYAQVQARAQAADRAQARLSATALAPSSEQPDLLGTENLDPVDQAQFLARFMPRHGRTTTPHPGPLGAPSAIRPVTPPPGASDDPDEFLKDDGPGRPILD